MAYQALYRVWRPRKFGELVGQDHVARTLQNACRHERIAHAYLFCGPRGTGKTSTARLLAKAVNCLGPHHGEPCNECSNCLAVNDGSSVDVIEIDAASNRGIEEIKSLRERVKFSPSTSHYRVYIIDEVHMLSHDAFNAFLKTLEEPPAHVIFILATTEAHKVPLTILSRCQRFDFRRISETAIGGRLAEIAGAAGLEVEQEALEIIARSAEGGLRDAISVLDQAAATGNSRVTAQDIHGLMGTVALQAIEAAADNLVHGRTRELLELAADLEQWGKDPKLFLRDLTGHLRRRLLAAPDGDAVRLWYVLHVLTEAEQSLIRAGQPGLVLELALIRASHPEWGFLPEEMHRRLEQVEQRLAARAQVAPPEEKKDDQKKEPKEKEQTMKPAGTREPVRAAARPPTGKKTGADEGASGAQGAVGPDGEVLTRIREVRTASDETAAASAEPAGPPSGAREKRLDHAPGQEDAVPKTVDNGPASPARPPLPGPAQGDALARIKQAWPAVLEKVKAENPHLYNFVRKANPVQVEGDQLILGFAGGDEFFREYFERGNFGAGLAVLLSAVCPGKWRIGSILADAPPAPKKKAPAAVEETGFYLEKLFDARLVKDDKPPRGRQEGGINER